MKTKTAFLALAFLACSTGLAAANPLFSASVRVAPGIRVAVHTVPVGEKVGCAPAPLAVRPVVEKRIVMARRFERNHPRRRYDRNDLRSLGDPTRRD